MVLTVSFALSLVTGLVCHHHRRRLLRRLDASVEASGPHDFAVRLSTIRQRRRRVHRIPPRVRDDRETPLSSERDGGELRSDLGQRRSDIFFRKGLDTMRARQRQQPDGQIS